MSAKRCTAKNRYHDAFTLVELLVVMAVIGVLVALLLPAIQAARESSRRTSCTNNLKQIGLALHLYHDVNSSFPPGCIEARPFHPNGRQIAWSALILPYLEEDPLYDQIDFDSPFDSPENSTAARVILPVYLCPTTPRSSPLQRGRGPCDYGGIYGERITSHNRPPKGTMLFDRAISFRDIHDGKSNTLVIAEDSNWPDGQWINGRNIFDQAFAINDAPKFENDIRSLHPGGANGTFCDGSVRFLSETMDLHTLAAICTRAGQEPVGPF